MERYLLDTNIIVQHVTDQEFTEDVLGYYIKYVDAGHLKQLGVLPALNNHSDPADRMIIAQSIAENLPVITSDTKFRYYKKYGLEIIWNR